ncbi:hypothetical protein LV84_03379 [Algoriphagus ratkowskyi]|uniref:Uncharacterized protein n=1 Tax=Algoriphagus ratkowskyi TaxID=57028 RepID=A0A2W7REW4_9BACT|nr:hypothetical protein LV84_03379 [Algoriphagus ratkowskyi]
MRPSAVKKIELNIVTDFLKKQNPLDHCVQGDSALTINQN